MKRKRKVTLAQQVSLKNLRNLSSHFVEKTFRCSHSRSQPLIMPEKNQLEISLSLSENDDCNYVIM
jgi:hypothetical protein